MDTNYPSQNIIISGMLRRIYILRGRWLIVLDQDEGGMAGSINVVHFIMNQGKGMTPFDQQQNFSHQLFGIIQILCGKL